MSKSKGTFIKARTFLEHIDPLYLRFYFASKMNSSIDDIDLNLEDFMTRVNSDLIGKITNLASRGASMINKKFDAKIGTLNQEGKDLVKFAQAKESEIAKHYENRDFSKAMISIREIADHGNRYFDEQQPWVTIKESPDQAYQVLSAVINVFRVMAIYLKPIMPNYVAQVELLFKEQVYVWQDLHKTLEEHNIDKFSHLAKRIEQKQIDALVG